MDSIDIQALRDLALEHLPDEIREQSKRNAKFGEYARNSAFPLLLGNSRLHTAVHRLAAELATYTGLHPDGKEQHPTELTDEYAAQCAAAESVRYEIEARLIETARRLCLFVGRSEPAWLTALDGTLASPTDQMRESAPSTITYHLPMFPRLLPRTAWKGERMAEIDLFSLVEAASMASKHANTEVTPNAILRAAGRGEIRLLAIVHRAAKTQPCREGDVPLNAGKPIPERSIPTLPLTACQALAHTGRACWRTIDGYEMQDDVLLRYSRWRLTDDEPDFVTVPEDCRITGFDVHALADASRDVPEAVPPADDTPAQKDFVAPMQATPDRTTELAALFDAVGHNTLDSIFKCQPGTWARHTERAKRTGLDAARTGRGVYNPFLAGLWWIEQSPQGWTLERLYRTLANHLPPRSMDSKYMLTGDYD